jgi:signal transduction histidine kinase
LENLSFTQEESTAIFRIFQEALTNIIRHANATEVEVDAGNKKGVFVLTISDNGQGIREDEATGENSMGILGMRERAHLINGEIEINGVAGEGTVIQVRVPMKDSKI